MLVASVLPMSLYYFPDLVPFELSVPSRKSQDLVAGSLDRAGLVAVDMARIGRRSRPARASIPQR